LIAFAVPLLMLTLGFDIGGTFIKAVALKDMEVIARGETPVQHESIEALCVQLAALRKELDPHAEAKGAGVAVAGLVDKSTGRLTASPHLPSLRNVDAKPRFDEALEIPVSVMNDATAAAFAEVKYGAARGFAHVLLITAGTGVGGGLVLNGQPYEGASGFAGEIGHVPVEPLGDACACGRHGCLETECGAYYLVGRAMAAIGSGVHSSLSKVKPVDAAAIFEAARNGDAFALNLIDRAGSALGRACAMALQILDLERIVIGGGLARSADLLIPRIMAAARARTFGEIFDRATFVAAELGHQAGAIGAAAVAMDRAR
jgi:glucokinase